MDPKQKIYLVSTSMYSYQDLHAIFSTKEKAQDYVRSNPHLFDMANYKVDDFIDEWDLDSTVYDRG